MDLGAGLSAAVNVRGASLIVRQLPVDACSLHVPLPEIWPPQRVHLMRRLG